MGAGRERVAVPRTRLQLTANSSSERAMSHREEEAILIAIWLRRREKKKANIRRKFWVRPIFSKCKEQGEFHHLLQEMRLCDPDSHFADLRMSKERFDKLLKEVL